MTPGPTVAGYTIIRPIGAGGMAQVFEALDLQSGRRVALKMLAPHATDAEDLQRFQREASVLRGLSHPSIITIYEIDVRGGRPFIAMELLEGGSVEDLLRSRGPLPMRDALRLMIAVLGALAHAHGRGIIHRDIKPANVLLRADGTPVAADFDLARPQRTDPRARITAQGDRLGTPAYMAPEQLRGDDLDARTDLYACGVMLFELIAGRLPFEGDISQIIVGHLQQPPPLLRSFAPGIPSDLELLLGRLLAKDPAERPASAEALIGALEDLLAGRPTALLQPRPAPPPAVVAPPPAAAAPRAPLRTRAIVAIGAALAIGAAGWSVLSRPAAPAQPPTVEISVSTTVSATVEIAVTVEPRRTALPTATPDVTIAATEGSALWIDSPVMANARQVEGEDGGIYRVGSLGVTQVLTTEVAIAFAEIEEEAPAPGVRPAIVRVALYDAAGAAIGEGEGLTLTPLGESQRTSAVLLAVIMRDGATAEQVARAELAIRRAPPTEGFRAVGLAIDGEPAARPLVGGVPAIEVAGVALNATGAPVRDAAAVLLLYDRRGRLVGAEDSALAGAAGEGEVAPGERAPFTLSALSLGPEIAGFRVYVVGLQP